MSMQRYDGVVQDSSGAAISGATVTVRVLSSGALAVVYSDEVLTAKTNPLTTTTDGSFWFYAADDDYTIAATYGGATYTLGDVTLHSPEAWRQFTYKLADETVNNSNALQDDDDLLFTVLAGETWEFTAILKLTTDLNADFRYQFTGPAGAGYVSGQAYNTADALVHAQNGVFGAHNAVVYAGNVINAPVTIGGFFVATASGTVNLQWAQNTAHASNTQVLIGSFLIARKVLLA